MSRELAPTMDDYAYINARVHAMQSRLFDRGSYDRLLAQNTAKALVESLLDSPYGGALAETTESATDGRRIELALRRDLTWCLAKLRDITSGRPHVLMEAVLSGWDAYNLKTVLRGKKAAAPIEEVLASTFPVGVLDEVALGELVRAPTLKAVADILETWRNPLARPLAKGLRALGETNSLQSLEFELDRFVYAQALSMVKNGDDDDLIAKRYIQLLGDKTNLLSALRYLEERSVLSPLEAARYFLEADGGFTRKHFQLVVTARDLRQGLSLLAGTPYGWLAEAFPQGEAVFITKVERKLDSILLAEAKRLARHNPLGVGVTLAYLVQKINEVRNIRLILRAKVIGMSTEQLTEWLAIPAA